jgi:hypothetical protein
LKAIIANALIKRATVLNQLAAATTIAQINAIVWPP